MSKIKRISTFFIAIILAVSSTVMSVSAASISWTPRYDTLNSGIGIQRNEAKTKTFTVKGKKNKKLYIQMHVGYDNSESSKAIALGFREASYYYNVIKNKTRFDITVKEESSGKIVAQYKNVKYGHVTVFNCSNKNYTVTVRSYFSSFNLGVFSDRAASFYAQWSASYYFN